LFIQPLPKSRTDHFTLYFFHALLYCITHVL